VVVIKCFDYILV